MRSLNSHYNIKSLSLFLLIGEAGGGLFAQEGRLLHTTESLSLIPASNVPVSFLVDADLSTYSIPEAPLLWGMDVAWDSEDNVRRGTNYIGKEYLSVGRVSFQPSDLVDANGELSAAQKNTLQRRLDHIALSGIKDIVLNCDHEVLCNKDNFPNADQNYANYYGKPEEWLKVIKATVNYCRNKGFNVVTISPFNEPDYTAWKEGTQAHFKAIAKLISEDPDLAGIRISAGNTLNCDQALSWYKAVLPYANEGNTHQLAGSFDNYAKFWQTVRANGHHATADELHNVGEAFIGAHYGMQTGIWWGWDGAARGEYCRASRTGKEIGYGENRAAWSAATVYKREDGRIDAFLGTSERQSTTSAYSFISTDHPVYFDGVGPYYSYSVTMPGGTAYQTGQVNAEHKLGIQYGEDIPMDAIVPGKYVIMNAHSKLCIGTYSNYTNSGTPIVQRKYSTTPTAYYQWSIESLPKGSGGDQNYFILRWGKETSYVIDVTNWGTSAGDGMIAYPGGLGTNEQWFVEYAGDNFWYIRSRHSGLYMEVKGSSTAANAVVQQAQFTGNANQKWRFMPLEGSPKLELDAPEAPTGLTVQVRSASVLLSWNENVEEDLAGYLVLRDGDVIARLSRETMFLDNDVRPGIAHQYSVKAVDNSRNASAASEPLEVTLSDEPALILHYTFESDSLDESGNMLNPVSVGKMSYNNLRYKEGANSCQISSKTGYMMLPPAVGYYDEVTFAMWVYVSQTTAWQRIFDFGNGTDQYIFLTPSNGSEMRLVFKNKGDEQFLSAKKLTVGWHHIAVTLSPDSVALFTDGASVSSTAITIRPSDFLPKRNYIGQSQFSADPLMTGYWDDIRVYNFPLSAEQIAMLIEGGEPVEIQPIESRTEVAPTVYTLDGRVQDNANVSKGLYVRQGRVILNK